MPSHARPLQGNSRFFLLHCKRALQTVSTEPRVRGDHAITWLSFWEDQSRWAQGNKWQHEQFDLVLREAWGYNSSCTCMTKTLCLYKACSKAAWASAQITRQSILTLSGNQHQAYRKEEHKKLSLLSSLPLSSQLTDTTPSHLCPRNLLELYCFKHHLLLAVFGTCSSLHHSPSIVRAPNQANRAAKKRPDFRRLQSSAGLP